MQSDLCEMESLFEIVYIYSCFNNQDHISTGHVDWIKWDINKVPYYGKLHSGMHVMSSVL